MTTLGLIVGTRGFFPDKLAKEGRKEVLDILKQEGIKAITLSPNDTKYGAIETYDDAMKCAALFKENASKIDGILITLPNFGDEKAVANAIRHSGLNVPILVQAYNDTADKMGPADRRDSFCGKMSVCNNLKQYNIPFSLTSLHTVDPKSESFRQDLRSFTATCRIIAGLKNVRFGAIGARTNPFNTVRFSEKLLEASGISIETIDLSEVYGMVGKLADNDKSVQAKLRAITKYVATDGIPKEALVKMAKLGLVVDRWMKQYGLKGSAIQCWTSLEEYFGVVPCTIMSMMSESLLPSACEVDVPGLLGMYILQLASGQPSALLDWNNNYGDDEDKCVMFHCSNLPKSFFTDVKMDYQAIIAGSVGKDNTYGTCVGKIAPGPFTFLRLTTNDFDGEIRAYCGEGKYTNDKLDTFGGYGVAHIPGLQVLLEYACSLGFEHHVATNKSQVSRGVVDALETYLDWDVYYHQIF
jgi:L-fucose isomerase-like protein